MSCIWVVPAWLVVALPVCMHECISHPAKQSIDRSNANVDTPHALTHIHPHNNPPSYPHITLTKLELALPLPHLDADGAIPVSATVTFNNVRRAPPPRPALLFPCLACCFLPRVVSMSSRLCSALPCPAPSLPPVVCVFCVYNCVCAFPLDAPIALHAPEKT